MSSPRRRHSLGAFGAAGAMWLALVLAAFPSGPWIQPVLGVSLLPQPDFYETIHDRKLVVPAPGVLANDIGLLGNTAVLESDPSHGTLVLRSDGGFTYNPANGFVGTDSFRYHPSGLIVISTLVTLTVTNTAPAARDDSYDAVTGVTLDVPAPGVLANDSDSDGDSLTASLVDGGGNGSLSLSANGSFTYKSGGSFTGIRTFTYRVSDGIDWSGTATVSIQVAAPDPTPTPKPTPTPTPTPTPLLPFPLPSLALPTIPSPTLAPTETPILPAATLAPVAGIVPGSEPSAQPTSAVSPSPSSGRDVTSSPAGASDAGGGAGGTDTSGGEGGVAVTDRFELPDDAFTAVDVVLDPSFDGFGSIEWAVPAFALGVPGLLVFAIGAQGLVGVAWLPVVRRWLAGVGVRRRHRTA